MNTTTSAATLRQSEGIPVGTTDRLSRIGSAGGAGYATKRCTDLIAAPHKVICRAAVRKGCGPFCGFAANKSRNNKVKDKIDITSYNPCGCVFFSLDSAPQNWYAFQVCHVYCT